jgi:hypothetical protein
MPGDEPLTLAGIRHCHRGFTGPTLQSMVEDLTSFLAHHPREVVVLGINNLFGIEGDAVAELARLVVKVTCPPLVPGVGLVCSPTPSAGLCSSRRVRRRWRM